MTLNKLSAMISEFEIENGHPPDFIILSEQEVIDCLKSQTLDHTYDYVDLQSYEKGKLKFFGTFIKSI